MPTHSNITPFKLSGSTFLSSFADDTKLYCQSKDRNNCANLQRDLNTLSVWSKLNHMSINIDKSIVLYLGKSNTKNVYSICDLPMTESSSIKDIGIWMDSSASFSNHIAKITLDANRMLGFIVRTFSCITIEIFKVVFKQLIRPKIENATQVCSSNLQKDIRKLENIERRSTKYVVGLSHIPYRERMRILGLICLENRRHRADLT